MITVSKVAIAIAVAGPLAAATVGELSAGPVPTSAVAVKAAASAAATDVQYRGYDHGPYAYRRCGGYPYPNGGYTYWYPALSLLGPQHPEYRERLLLRCLARAPSAAFVRVTRSSECLEQSVARIFASGSGSLASGTAFRLHTDQPFARQCLIS